jgi:hypothetical protein
MRVDIVGHIEMSFRRLHYRRSYGTERGLDGRDGPQAISWFPVRDPQIEHFAINSVRRIVNRALRYFDEITHRRIEFHVTRSLPRVLAARTSGLSHLVVR